MSSALPSVEVEFRDVSYHAIGDHARRLEILRSLSLTLFRGETLILLGRSGSGKTTALKLVNRLLVPMCKETGAGRQPVDAGLGSDQLRPPHRLSLQGERPLPHFTVEQNTALVPRLKAGIRNRMTARLEELCASWVSRADDFRRRFPQ